MKPRLLDLFSGIGGFSLGLQRAGFDPVAFCEILGRANLSARGRMTRSNVRDGDQSLAGVWPLVSATRSELLKAARDRRSAELVSRVSALNVGEKLTLECANPARIIAQVATNHTTFHATERTDQVWTIERTS